MATADPSVQDPLLLLRRAIASSSLPTPTTSSELSTEHATEDLAQATHLFFSHPTPLSLPLNTPTRFISATLQSAVDLRSIFFAWKKQDVAIPEYFAAAQELNEALKQKEAQDGSKVEEVQTLVFVERTDLITWLEGASDVIEYIKPLEGAAAAAEAAAAAAGSAQADASAGIAAGAKAGAAAPAATTGAHGSRAQKPIDPKLQEIYNGERKTGDRNSVLRGIKETVSLSFLQFHTTPRSPLYVRNPNLNSLANCHPGFLPRPQKLGGLPRPWPQSPWSTHKARQQGSRCPYSLCRPLRALTQIQRPSRPYHSALTLRFLPHPHVEHQILPPRRCLRPPRPPHPQHGHRSQLHGTSTPSPPQGGPLKPQQHRPELQTHQVHSRGWNIQLQA